MEADLVLTTVLLGTMCTALVSMLCYYAQQPTKNKIQHKEESDSEANIEAILSPAENKKEQPKKEKMVQDTLDEYEPEVVHHDNGLREMTMHLGDDSFPVFIGHNNLASMVATFKDHVGEFDMVYLGYDTNTDACCAPQLEKEFQAQGIKYFKYVMGVTEKAKQINTLGDICRVFFENGGTRKTIVIPVGGGIVGNTFGLAAALLFRGIRLVQCPTTLLSAHDAAASSQKQAINHAGYKNVMGCFYKPLMAMVDTSFFKTLGVTEIKAGLGELTKNAALFGGPHYELMKRTTMIKGANLNEEELCDATFSGLGAKDMLLKHDPREKTLAIIFEYGHTVGHALELTEGVETSHGEGVTIGMLAASYISNRMGIMSDEDRRLHDEIVYALQPDIVLPDHDITEEVLDKVQHDNKRGYLPERKYHCPFILMEKIGKVHAPNKYYLEFVPEDIVRAAIVYVVDLMRTGLPQI